MNLSEEASSSNPITLKDLVDYYEKNIRPYKYVYHCAHGLKLEFDITEDQLCHLLFGTIPSGIHNRSKFAGQTGYNAIKSGEVEIKDLPHKTKSKAKNRIKYFFYIDKLLSNPSVIHYNGNIVRKGDHIKIGESLIDANYLFTKSVMGEKKILHFFLKTVGKKIEPITFFAQEDTCYIENQLRFKVLRSEKIKK